MRRQDWPVLLSWSGVGPPQSQGNFSMAFDGLLTASCWSRGCQYCSVVVKSTSYFCYYLITMQVLCKNKLWHSWCAGVSRLWDVSHQRWFDYLEKLLFYLSWLCLAYFMELTAGFLPTLTFCFSTDLSSVPWSVLFTGQEVITAFKLINLCTVCGTWNTNSLVSSCCCFLLLKLFLCSVVQ